MKRILVYISLLLFYASTLLSQTIREKYDLDFQRTTPCTPNWWFIYTPSRCSFSQDTTIRKEGKHPLKIAYVPTALGNNDMRFTMLQHILLPEHMQGKQCHISLEYKAKDITKLKVITSAIDGTETTSQADTLQLENSDWTTKAFSLTLSPSTRALKIRMEYIGNFDPQQTIWLNKIDIDVDGKDITGQPSAGHERKDSLRTIKTFNKDYIQLLSERDVSTPLNNIPNFKEKTIIGLGAFSIGSHEVNKAMFQFCTELIARHDAKLILLELPSDASMLYDLYIQGFISTDYEKKIEEGLQSLFVDKKMYLDFLRWMRKYNETANRKVHVIGIDEDILLFSKSFLHEYFHALMGEEQGNYYLELIRKNRHDKLIECVKNDAVLKKKIGEDNHQLVMSFLYEYLSHSTSRHYTIERQREMVIINRYLNFPRYFLHDKEKCVLLGNHYHFSRFPSLLEGMATIGSMHDFYKRYENKDNYFAITFQAGRGSVYQQECGEEGGIRIDTLDVPAYNSFESAALHTGLDYFYYPTEHLSDDLLQMLSVPDKTEKMHSYIFASPKQRFDGIVFIKESTPIQNIDKDWPPKSKEYIEKRAKEYKFSF